MVNATTASWDWELLTQLKIPTRIFKPLSKPGTVVGQVTAAIKDRIGFDTTVVLPATHDTGSAVMAVPMADDDSLYVTLVVSCQSGMYSIFPMSLIQYGHHSDA